MCTYVYANLLCDNNNNIYNNNNNNNNNYVISHSGSESSLVNIVHRLAFLLKFNLIIHHYFTYINAFTLVHLSVFEFASINLTLVRFTLKKGAGVPENYVF